jgi:hypothetical protein
MTQLQSRSQVPRCCAQTLGLQSAIGHDTGRGGLQTPPPQVSPMLEQSEQLSPQQVSVVLGSQPPLALSWKPVERDGAEAVVRRALPGGHGQRERKHPDGSCRCL